MATLLPVVLTLAASCIRINRPVLEPVPDPQWTTLPTESPPAEPPAPRRAPLNAGGVET